MSDSPVELPSRLVVLPFRNKVLLPGTIVRIRCTNPNRNAQKAGMVTDIEDKELVDACVLCKIFRKSGIEPKIGARYGAPFNEEDWNDASNEECSPCAPSVVRLGRCQQCRVFSMCCSYNYLMSMNSSEHVVLFFFFGL